MSKIQRQYCILFLSMSVLVVICLYTRFAVSQTHPPGLTVTRMSFEDRVKYQRAIEVVYWRHRIWPKQNNLKKPPLDEVMPLSQIRTKVENYLRQSNALEASNHPIRAQQLQAEIDRMVTKSKQPAVLNEIFVALGNDPYVIAEALARPILSDRLIRKLYEDRFGVGTTETSHAISDGYTAEITNVTWSQLAHQKNAKSFDEWWKQASSSFSSEVAAPAGIYRIQKDQLTNSCANDTWTPTITTNAPAARSNHTAVWTGTEMIVWGGENNDGYLASGARYNPSTDSWTATTTTNAPEGRTNHTAVWTGTEMIVWGGFANDEDFASGGRYNPTSNSWTATNSTGAPQAREAHTAVWTGTEMIVWGGCQHVPGVCLEFASGGRYQPSTDSWTPTNQTNAPAARVGHTAVWTGTEMIVWGGNIDDEEEGIIALASGGRYNPTSNSWTATNSTGAPEGRFSHTAIWTGTEMIVWGGFVDDGQGDFVTVASGARYNPTSNSWTTTTSTGTPAARAIHTAVWTGTEMIVWGGFGNFLSGHLASGARYNPTSDSWTATTTTNAPEARSSHTAIWTGTEMIVWGGSLTVGATGGRYCATESQIALHPKMRVRRAINPRSLGKITVTLFTDNGFKGPDVDLSTIRFGRAGTEAAVLRSKLVDIDDDSDLDLVLQFKTAATGIVCGDTLVVLTGQLQSGQNFAASKAIKTVGCL